MYANKKGISMGNMENSVKPHENKMGTMPMTRLILTMSLPAIFQ